MPAPTDDKPRSDTPAEQATRSASQDSSTAHGGAVPPASRHVSTVSNIEEMVRDIRSRLAEVSTHEVELQRREQEFEEQYNQLATAARRAAAREIEQEQQRIARQQVELRQLAREAAARRTRLDEREQQLRLGAQDIEHQRQGLGAERAELRRRMERQRDRNRRRRQMLRRRISAVRAQEHELGRRIQLARTELNEHRKVVEQRRAQLDQRAGQLEKFEQSLRARRLEVEQQQSERDTLTARIEQQRGALTAERARLDLERHELEQARQSFEQQRDELLDRQREFDRRWQRTHGRRHELSQCEEELTGRQRVLDQQEIELVERQSRLENREEQFREQSAGVEAERQRLAELRDELERRQGALDQLNDRAAHVEQEGRQISDAAVAMREQVEARENECRQAALSLELERQELEHARAALEAGRREFEQIRAQRDEEVQQAQATLRELSERLESRPTRGVGGRRGSWWRSIVLAVIVGVVAGAGWLLAHPPQYEALVRLDVMTSSGAVDCVLNEHRQGLTNPDLLARADKPGLAERWTAACVAGRVTASAAGGGNAAIDLHVRGPDGRGVAALALAAGEVYAEQVNSVSPDANLPPALREVAGWRAALVAELDQIRRRQVQDRTELDALPASAAYTGAVRRCQDLAAELDGTAGELGRQRAELATRAAADTPVGVVAPGALEASLEADTIYGEDQAELRAAALEYRTELAVSMLQLVDPARVARQAVTEFIAAIAEQQELDPPEAVGGLLEDCHTRLTTAQRELEHFEQEWRPRVGIVQEAGVDDDALGLIRQQQEASDLARRRGDALVNLIDGLGARIERLGTEGSGSTREVVVVALLRSEHAALRSAAEGFLSAAGQTALTENFELDALDRKLRGLHTRLAQRSESLGRQLQAEADEQARRVHQTEIEEVREGVRQLEQRREVLVADLMSALREQQRSEENAQAAKVLGARIAQSAAREAWIEDRVEEIDVRLDDARRRAPQPDRITCGPAVQQTLHGASYEEAARAGGGAAVATLLVCGVMMIPGRGQRA